jgi:guanylate kinase
VLLCIDVKGAKTIVEEFPQALKIFIKAPSLKVLESRLKARASENLENLNMRLKMAGRELKESKYYDHIVINLDLKKALEKLQQIIYLELGIN